MTIAQDLAAGSIGQHPDRSHWWRKAQPIAPYRPLDEDIKADICIIGGGITGLSTALHLRRADPGARVVLLEGDQIGSGASGRNAGQLVVQFGTDWQTILRRYGPRQVGDGHSYMQQGIEFIESLAANDGLAFDYANTGTLKVGLRAEEDRQVEAFRRYCSDTGQSPYLQDFTAAEVQHEVASPYLGAGFLDRRGGTFNPLKLMRGLHELVISSGGVTFEFSPVVHVSRASGHLTVHTGMGSVQCQKLIFALNGYESRFAPALDGMPRRRQRSLMVRASASLPPSERQWAAVGWARRCGVNIVSDLFFSFAPTATGEIVAVSGLSMDASTTAPEVDWSLRGHAANHIGGFFPALSNLAIGQTWGGLISTTPDLIPQIGETEDSRIIYACGCWGSGMPLGARHGRTLSDLALGRRTESTDLWFVQRQKRSWPRLLGEITMGYVLRHHNREARKIAMRLNPRLAV